MLSKYIIPIIAIVAALGGATFQAKVLAPKLPACNCSCPEQKPCHGIDYDKIKSKNLTIQNEQYITVSGDSLLIEKIKKVIIEELEKKKVARCK